ncbi:MAG: hypothetical protein RI885_342 [Actinomycetota bacterium]
MTSATNIDATAVNTIEWLSSPDLAIVVPVYQRQYRWDIGACEQLLTDIRAVSDAHDRHTHFLASILSAASADTDELVLIDGQQRITTLMLLVAAMHHALVQQPDADVDGALASRLEAVLVHSRDPSRTKLRPHSAWAEVFESVVLDRSNADDELRDSRFDDNYAFFRSQVPAVEVPRLWRGLQRLEHVAITLGADANAQQIFESLNSTGEPLRDHELIHNYVLMGLSHAEQLEIEQSFWLPIEQSTGDAIASFWRHYLVMMTGREIDLQGGRGVYDAFRHRFPRLDLDTLRPLAAEWRDLAQLYGVLLDPAREADVEISRHLGFANTFGRGMSPLILLTYRDYSIGAAGRTELIATLEGLQSLQLRRSVVGLGNERLVARLCRAREEGVDELHRAISRITPSDARVRVELKYGALPHPAYVLGRLLGAEGRGLEVDHIVPLVPPATWSGDGERAWADYSDDEQNSLRALAGSLGNLTLLEQSLAERASGLPFAEAKAVAYARSAVPATRALAQVPEWNTAAIAARTARLTTGLLDVWARSTTADIDDDGLTPILDAQHRRGWPRGWEREFEYVEYRGEHWEVYDVKHLFDRVFSRLWADARDSVTAFSARRGGPIFTARAWNGHWSQLDDTHHLYLGWDSHYMLSALQGVLDEAGLASEVSVKYSYVGALM